MSLATNKTSYFHCIKEHFDKHVNLLLISQGTVRHYCLIKDLNRLLSYKTKYKGKMFYCHYCLHGFIRQDLLYDHLSHCQIHGPQNIKLPDKNYATLKFKDYYKKFKVPFAVYADFESLTTKIDSAPQDLTISSTEKYQQHQRRGFSYMVVSEVDKCSKDPVVYRGSDSVDKFLECLLTEEKNSRNLKNVIPMSITPQQEREFKQAVNCHICEELLGADRVRVHSHLTGNYRGAAHNDCNQLQVYGANPSHLS